MPFKQNPYTEDEAALLNDILTPRMKTPAVPSDLASCSRSKASSKEDEIALVNNIITPRNKAPAAPLDLTSCSRSKVVVAKASNKGSTPSDIEIMASMMNRLTKLERAVKTQEQMIKDRDKKIAILEEKLQIYKKSREASVDPGNMEELEKRCLQLQNQVWEMEGFLNDYGMVWVGEKKEKECDEYQQEEEEPTDDVYTHRKFWHPGGSIFKQFSIDFDLVLENIKDLNVLAGEGKAHVAHTEGGARLKYTDTIPLTLFKNGIVMFQGPFRSYEELSTQQCIQDIMDGYFPSELQSKYPDGVPFKVIDKRDVVVQEKQLWNEFPGTGRTVGTQDNATMFGTQESTDSTQKITELPGRKLSVEQFLNKLPKTVIKGGKIIDIRNSVKAELQGSSGQQSTSVVLIETPVLITMKERLKMDEQSRPPSAKEISTLRLKSENGEQTYILKMQFTETIGDLRAHLDQHRGDQHLSYDIISTFPQKVYSDNTKTLQEYGLVPNTTLILRNKKARD
nr:PREDICTED: UBX domain-containing protein 11 isoform X1 [Latimeria chalumnae]|eukprot:XP_014342678.1 PREDICTED: UBX domain-containing protein 11 isoform X1 [Latimeria chalumnae]